MHRRTWDLSAAVKSSSPGEMLLALRPAQDRLDARRTTGKTLDLQTSVHGALHSYHRISSTLLDGFGFTILSRVSELCEELAGDQQLAATPGKCQQFKQSDDRE